MQQAVAVLCYTLLSNYGKWTTKTTTTTITTSKFIPVHTMLVHVRSTDLVPLILNNGCRWKCWSISHPGYITPLKVPSTHYTRSWVGPRTRLDIIERNKIFSPCHNSISRSSSPEPGHSSNYTIPAQYCKLSKSLLTTNCMKQGVPHRFEELPALYEPIPVLP